jgi:6-phosphofructokinase 2
MPSIVTLTFSPCIDKSTSIPALIPEKKLKCAVPKLEPGGGGINVARAIRKLGGNPTAVFPSGGYTGKYFNQLMESEGIESVIINTVHETRENIIVLDESTNMQYRFGMPGTPLSESEWKECILSIEKINDIRFIVASGSMPPGVPATVFTILAALAKQKNAMLVIDTAGEALRHAAGAGVYMLKPNLGELSVLAGVEKIDPDGLETIAREVLKKTGCEIMVVSSGEKGATLVTIDKTYKAMPPRVESKSTVGAGDSMVAGIIYSLNAGKGLEEALQFGVACGTATTMRPGTELFHKTDAEKLFSLIKNNTIS